MRRLALFVFVSIFTAASSFTGTSERLALEIRREKAKIGLMRKTGGFIRVPDSARGSCLFLNLQSRLPEGELAEPSQTLNRVLQSEIKFESRKSAFPGVSGIARLLSESASSGMVLIIDDPGYPISLVAPEANWGIVNVAALAKDSPDEKKLGARVRKELWRTFALTFGAGNSYHPGCIMKTVREARDLDRLLSSSVCPEPFGKIRDHLQKIGVTPYKRSTYKKACEQGWAPMPTNSYQKAIWEEFGRREGK